MLSNFEKHKNVYYITNSQGEFSKTYYATRKREGRIYSDDVVKKLPIVEKNHLYSNEWKLREKSTRRILKYLTKKNRPLKVLDLGCGNGWFSHCMSKLSNTEVYAVDINIKELHQAARVFNKNNCTFIYGDIFQLPVEFKNFDIITLNACVQYFADFHKLITTLTSILNSSGEIHIIDSPFYKEKALIKAKENSALYYKKIGIPSMKNHYFHHSYSVLKEYHYENLYTPKKNFIRGLFKLKDIPFPWIKINKVYLY